MPGREPGRQPGSATTERKPGEQLEGGEPKELSDSMG